MNFTQIFIIKIIKLYQILISPWIGYNCRYIPTCSNYMILSIKKWKIFKGFYIGLKRIIGCHPLGKSGYDPIK
ncbi:membrane protein insertion efficiency factor YidD [Blattabacterium cuenoti]|uniref:membrane protein insertion efficiency factor YidD n=1 Tax=Blattabacterium cuenoti TaxID=1653831 RepID=UPI00163CB1E5|nr:membrane protein insertion efficiency factor YidD [Blattabacterium cuenoti]